ncbi:hypothetical protein [Apilactobacillus quenuiae]|uniref:hypothetical protein n=1 Tax=Apilactobacillus quenuiae TaxID=2008377 RepID=UPI00142DB308|nr:hypothetical protein [Apilactobacillus quenuiae]
MCNSRIISICFVIFYLILLYFAFSDNMMSQMLAMKMMAVGMLAEAIISLVTSINHKNH